MYDLSSKFETFYKTHVVLPQADQSDLHHKKDLNLQRLKDGLDEYNEEENTTYSITEDCVQGSISMSTIIQNENNDYDIDIAIVFDKDSLGEKGPGATRAIVANALERKTKQFYASPEIKTSCVRVTYSDGYHIDFAVYRRHYDCSTESWIYEHAGSNWEKRELRGFTNWFTEKNKSTEGKIRKVLRLSKMFCTSRDTWINMPSGMLQTVLCEEKLDCSSIRIDELFYNTMSEIVNRLETDTEVLAPVDNCRNLAPRVIDKTKMTNWKNRLKSKLEDLDILFQEDCTQEEALQAWFGFFNHDFWDEQPTDSYRNTPDSKHATIRAFNDTEEFIEDSFPVLNSRYTCKVSCRIEGNGWRSKPLSEFLSVLKRFIPHNLTIHCEIVYTDCPEPYEILWKIRNVGPEAERRNDVRGQIENRGPSITENSRFFGNHYIECYIIKDGICVARNRTKIPISRR